jgi:hypothetical protein
MMQRAQWAPFAALRIYATTGTKNHPRGFASDASNVRRPGSGSPLTAQTPAEIKMIAIQLKAM